MPLAAVLFDMDGLLIDTEPVWLAAETELVGELGGTWTPADQQAILGNSMPRAARYIKSRSGTDWPWEQVAQALVDRFLELLGRSEIVIQPGALRLLQEVADSGLPFALVSASERRIMDYAVAALSRAGAPRFPITVAGDEVVHGKPHPEPYLKAARELGVEIGACVVLEDSASGVAAAHAAGAQVVALAHMVDHVAGDRIVVRQTLEGLTVPDLRALLA